MKRISSCLFVFISFLLIGCISSQKSSRDIELDENRYQIIEWTGAEAKTTSIAEENLINLAVHDLLSRFAVNENTAKSDLSKEYLEDLIRLALIAEETTANGNDLIFIADKKFEGKAENYQVYVKLAILKEFYLEIYQKLIYIEEKDALSGWNGFNATFETHSQLANFAAAIASPESILILQKYLEKIRNEVLQIQFIARSIPPRVKIGEKIASPVVIELRDAKANLLKDKALIALWRDKNNQGALGWKNQIQNTDANGRAFFDLGVILAEEAARISIEFPHPFLVPKVEIQDNEALLLIEELNNAIRNHHLTVELTIEKEQPVKPDLNIKTAVLLVEYDLAGKMALATTTSNFLISNMGEEVTQWTLFEVPLGLFADSTGSDFHPEKYHDQIIKLLPDDIQRLVFGKTMLTSYEETGNIHQISTEGFVHIYDNLGNLLGESVQTASSRGNNFETVMSLAWRSLGKNLANEVKKKLEE